jgi:integrase
MKLTQRIADTVALAAGKTETIHYDDAQPGFGLRIREGGSRMYVVAYKLGAKHRRMTLGSTAQLRLDEARGSAAKILARVRLGEDPAGEKAQARGRAADVFEAAIKRYLTGAKTRLRPRSYAAAEYCLLTQWKPLHGLTTAKIDRRMVASQLGRITEENGPASAGRARAMLCAFFAWAMGESLVEANPVAGTNRPYAGKGRERVLSEPELVEVWRAAGDDAYGTVVRLLILTGQRRSEIGGLKWSEIDFAARVIRLPKERVKNGRAHDVPLSDPAIALLRAVPQIRDLVFGAGANGLASFATSKVDLDQRVAATGIIMPPWVIHDLRRSVATRMAEMGIQPHIVEAVLNHVSGHKAGVAGIYNRAAYEREKRQALDLWGAHVMALVEGRAASVVPLQAGAS